MPPALKHYWARAMGLMRNTDGYYACGSPPRRVLELHQAELVGDASRVAQAFDFALRAAAASDRGLLAPAHFTVRGRRVPLHRAVSLPWRQDGAPVVLESTYYANAARWCEGGDSPPPPAPTPLEGADPAALMAAASTSAAPRVVVRLPPGALEYAAQQRLALLSKPCAASKDFRWWVNGTMAGR